MNRDDIRQEIKTAISCTDYLCRGKHNSPGGTSYICPFCGSGKGPLGTGALKYYEEDNTFHCHKCGRNGDVIDLICQKHGCSYNEALDIGARILGIKTDNDTSKAVAASPPAGHMDKLKGFLEWYAGQNSLKLTDIYDYCYGDFHDGLAKARFVDESGHKTFRWVHDDPSSKSGFRLNRGNCPDRLFVKGSLKDGTCFVTEGEKDALTVYGLYNGAIAAVSAENGAASGSPGNKWKPGYNEQLSGMDVYILCDNDNAGRSFAQTEAREINSTADKVYLLDISDIWPECPEKGDISDMVKALGKEKCRELLDAAVARAKPFLACGPAPEPGSVEDDISRFLKHITSDAFRPFKTGLPFFDELLDGGILPQSLLLLMASPSTGKTTLCQQIAETIAMHHKPVIYLNLEMSRETMLAKVFSARLNNSKKLPCKMSPQDVLKGYAWQPDTEAAMYYEADRYRKEIYPYLRYNPHDTGSNLDCIRKMLDDLSNKAGIAGEQAPAIVLDYLHLVTDDKKLDTSERIKQTVVMLKDYAIRNNTFAIGIVATNRQSNGRITLDSGRDSSCLEYTGDYVLSLEYEDIDNGNVRKGTDTFNDDFSRLQQANPRKMILRVLKNRLGCTGKSCYLDFYTESSYFCPGSKTEKDDWPDEVEFDVTG